MPITAIILIAIGLILLLIEIFILPGFGAAGIPGIIFILVGGVWIIWRQFVLSTAELSELGYQAPSAELENYAGKTGRALTPLRPAGTAIIDGSRVDVITEGGFISRGMPVKVVRVEGMRVIVQEIEE